jgi:hypothetical protein
VSRLPPSAVLFTLTLVLGGSALAQEPAAEEAVEDDPTEPLSEGVDPTRLDVERLPPEAIEITRDLYSHGFFFEGWIGGRGFLGGIGKLSKTGVYGSVGFGLEIFRFLWVGAAIELSLHDTAAPEPPSPTGFELLGAFAYARLQLNMTSWFAAWLGGEIGAAITFSDALPIYGVNGADEVGIFYGGTIGLDFHMKSRHTSIGLLGGARHYPGLASLTSESIGIHGCFYLRHVL